METSPDNNPPSFSSLAVFSVCLFLHVSWETFSCSGASLAGSEKVDKKMSYVWRVHFRRAFHRYLQTEIKMSRMRQLKKLERRTTGQKLWQNSALSLSRLRPSIFRTLNDIPNTHSFFGFKATRRLLLETEGIA